MRSTRGTLSLHAAETRTRVLEAALSAFWKKGYQSTTTREIAMAVGLSVAGVYVYFDSKSDLLAEIVEDSHSRLVEMLNGVATRESSPTARLSDLVATFSATSAREHCTALVAERELGLLDGETLERVRQQRTHIFNLIRETIVDGIRSGEFLAAEEETHDLVFAVVAISKDLARWYKPNGPLTPDELGVLHGKWALRLVHAVASDDVPQAPKEEDMP